MTVRTWFVSRPFLFLLVLCFAAFGFSTTAHADSSSVRAARLTFLQGTVSVNPPDNSGGVPAQLNLPLLSGVQLATGVDGEAEVEFEDGSVARLTPNSALSLDNLAVEPNGVFTTSLSLVRGLAYFELRATPQYRYSVNAGGDVLSPIENATVRVNFDVPPAIFAVLDGTVQIGRQNGPNAADGYQTDVRAGESLRADAGDTSRYFLTQEIDQDSWDQWNEDQDQAAAAQASNSTSVRNNYAGAQGYGWSDLDADGNWYNVPGQGPVWQPDVAATDSSFDPYGDGAWVDYSGVGYVWASAYPWGWTPYRCGTWSFFGGFGWGWAPGAACGGLGWGFAGGGRPVNVGSGPGGYRPIRVPTPGHGPERPVLPVRATNGPLPVQRPTTVQRGPRQIAGATVTPIKPIGGGVTITNGSAAGSSLRRDFPIDSSSKAPVMGTASTSPPAVHTYRSSGGRLAGSAPAAIVSGPAINPPAAVSYPANVSPGSNGPTRRGMTEPSGTPPANTGQFHPVPVQPSNPPASSGQYHAVPSGRLQSLQSPQPTAPAQRSMTPPPSPSRPTYSPPPAPARNSPPPPPSHPASAPPPAASQGRSSPK